MGEPTERTRISVQVPNEDYEALREYAEKRRLSLSDVVRDALVQMLEKVKVKK